MLHSRLMPIYTEFIDKNDVHVLDIKLPSDGIPQFFVKTLTQASIYIFLALLLDLIKLHGSAGHLLVSRHKRTV